MATRIQLLSHDSLTPIADGNGQHNIYESSTWVGINWHKGHSSLI